MEDPAIILTAVSFQEVELTVGPPVDRTFRVLVGSGRNWLEAIRFPFPVGGTNCTSSGDDRLDSIIRLRAVEELVRLKAAVDAARDAEIAHV